MPAHDAFPGVTCILNAAAGTCDPEATANLFKRIAAEHGVTARVIVPKAGADLSALAREAVQSGSRIVVAGGGDGTVNAVASVTAGTDAVVGVLPLGTLNHFAKDLGIPLDPGAAIRNVFTGRVAAVDLGEVNGQVFLNNSSLGLYPRIVRQREEHRKRGQRKWIACARALVYALRHHATIYLRIKIDDHRAETRKTPFVFVGNNRYEIAGLEIGKRASLSSERLWI